MKPYEESTKVREQALQHYDAIDDEKKRTFFIEVVDELRMAWTLTQVAMAVLVVGVGAFVGGCVLTTIMLAVFAR